MPAIKRNVTIPLEMDLFLRKNFLSASKILQNGINDLMKQEQKKKG